MTTVILDFTETDQRPYGYGVRVKVELHGRHVKHAFQLNSVSQQPSRTMKMIVHSLVVLDLLG